MIVDDDPEAVGRAIGGHARAAALTKEERREIAQRAAAARWGKDLPHASHEGAIMIGDTEIACAVLNTGQRVITQSGFMLALGRASAPASTPSACWSTAGSARRWSVAPWSVGRRPVGALSARWSAER